MSISTGIRHSPTSFAIMPRGGNLISLSARLTFAHVLGDPCFERGGCSES